MARILTVILGMVAAFVVAVPGTAVGLNIEVDTVADTVPDALPNGCEAVGGDECTLREAIILANSDPDADVISFDAGIAGSTITLEQDYAGGGEADGDLDISTSVTINGTGETISAAGIRDDDNHDRVFDIIPSSTGPTDVVVELNDLTVRDGYTQGPAMGDDNGGGIRSFNIGPSVSLSVTLDNVYVLDNVDNPLTVSAPDPTFGGGVFALETTLTIRNSTIGGNLAQIGGGVTIISDSTTATIVDTTISGNGSDLADSSINTEGAGLYVSGATTIDNSLIADNGGLVTNSTPSGGTVGGALTNFGGGFTIAPGPVPFDVFVTDSVIRDNEAEYGAGGICTFITNLNIDGTTISGNDVTDEQSSASFQGGGGLLVVQSEVTVTNSTISGNTAIRGAAINTVTEDSLDTDISRVDLVHVTVTDNDLPSGATLPTVPPDFGALMLTGDGTAGDLDQITFFNSILQSPDTARLVTCLDFNDDVGEFVTAGGNSDDDDTCGLDPADDKASVTQDLGPLQDNGGPRAGDAPTRETTSTHELLRTAEGVDTAIDVPTVSILQSTSGDCGPVSVDQRDVTRPRDGDDDSVLACDRGAYERSAPTTDVALTKGGPSSASPGDTVTFSLGLTVLVDTANAVVVSDTLPAGLTFVSASNAACSESSGVVTCSLGDLPAGTSLIILIVTTAGSTGTRLNSACAFTATTEPDTSNNCDDHSVVVRTSTSPPPPPPPPTPPPPPPVTPQRVDGPERIATSIAGSREGFPDGADAVVLTRSDLFPDAQAGTPLAIDRDAPLLLSQPESLTPETEEEILRLLDPGDTVFLLGGTAALSQAVFDRIVMLGLNAVRIGGANRFGTAALIATELGDPNTLLAADGGNFPAAILAGAAATVAGAGQGINAAVLLTSDVTIPVETRDYLAGRDDAPTLLAIGEPASTAFPAAEAVVGVDPFDLSANVAVRFFPDPPAIGVATALEFADGLTGGAVVNRPDIGPGPILLTDRDELPQPLRAYLEANVDSISRLLIFGGSAAVSPAVEDEIVAILQGS